MQPSKATVHCSTAPQNESKFTFLTACDHAHPASVPPNIGKLPPTHELSNLSVSTEAIGHIEEGCIAVNYGQGFADRTFVIRGPLLLNVREGHGAYPPFTTHVHGNARIQVPSERLQRVASEFEKCKLGSGENAVLRAGPVGISAATSACNTATGGGVALLFNMWGSTSPYHHLVEHLLPAYYSLRLSGLDTFEHILPILLMDEGPNNLARKDPYDYKFWYDALFGLQPVRGVPQPTCFSAVVVGSLNGLRPFRWPVDGPPKHQFRYAAGVQPLLHSFRQRVLVHHLRFRKQVDSHGGHHVHNPRVLVLLRTRISAKGSLSDKDMKEDGRASVGGRQRRMLHDVSEGPNDISNVAALRVSTELAQLDVEYSFLGDMSLAEQIQTVMGYDILVGVEGGQMIFQLFSRLPNAMIYLFPLWCAEGAHCSTFIKTFHVAAAQYTALFAVDWLYVVKPDPTLFACVLKAAVLEWQTRMHGEHSFVYYDSVTPLISRWACECVPSRLFNPSVPSAPPPPPHPHHPLKHGEATSVTKDALRWERMESQLATLRKEVAELRARSSPQHRRLGLDGRSA